MYTVGMWLSQSKRNANEVATMQPVSMRPNEFWTDDFATVARWVRSQYGDKRIQVAPPVRRRKSRQPNLFGT